jgi:transposase
VRVTTAFNRMLGLPGAWVRDVAFGRAGGDRDRRAAAQAARLLGLRRARSEDQGAPRQALAASRSGGVRCVIECRLRRLYCPGCGDRLRAWCEWARGRRAYTRDFEDWSRGWRSR